MHKISYLKIKNYRSIVDLDIYFDEITALVGNNNCGKSNLLSAIKWFLRPTSFKKSDFYNPGNPVEIEGVVDGVSSNMLDALDPKHRVKIVPYVNGRNIKLRRVQNNPGDAASKIVLEIFNPSGQGRWDKNPTGISSAIQALFPEPIYVEAMDDANEDVCKNKSGTTIAKLISKIIEPFIKSQEKGFEGVFSQLKKRIEVDGADRAEELKKFDKGVSDIMDSLFPGIELNLHIPTPTLRELFKGGTIKAKESQLNRASDISDLGHGAQRMAQMSLIRYLSEVDQAECASRTILLIDEPELYLHPNAIEKLRKSIHSLSTHGYQIVYSTHSPLMIERELIKSTCLIRKDEKGHSFRRKSVKESVEKVATSDFSTQMDVLFDLENAKDLLFSDSVVIGEGNTEKILIPELYEKKFGNTLGHDRIAFIGLQGSGNVIKCKKIVEAMGLPVVAIVDLDYAFKIAHSAGLLDEDDDDLSQAKKLFETLSPSIGFDLGDDGYPKKSSIMRAEEAFAKFAKTKEGERIASSLHKKLASHSIWLWRKGSIESHLGIEVKKRSRQKEFIIDLRSGELPKDSELGSLLDKLRENV